MSEHLRDQALDAELEHPEQEHCGCGHDHHEEHQHRGCGHNHHEEHQHCGCGHDHHDHHEHHDHCSCGHEHDTHQEHRTSGAHHRGGRPAIYTVTGLDCANCAAKLEQALNQLPEVEEANLTFATGQLRVWGKAPETLLDVLQRTADQVEPGVTLALMQKRSAPAQEEEEETSPLRLILGAVLYVLVLLLLPEGPVKLAGFVVSYLVLGFDVLKKAVTNCGRGQIFDENFLMSLATIGAFVIGEYPEAVGVMLFYQIGEFFEDLAVRRSRSHIMEALDLRPESVLLVRDDGKVESIPAENAAKGDLIQIRPGDRVPLDGRVAEGESLVDTSPVTGEPVPVTVRPGRQVISGCVNTTGLLTVEVEQPLATSMVTRILESVENAAASKPKMDRFITRFSRVYTPIVVGLAALAAVVPSLLDGEWMAHLKTACTFLVISCPCALVLSVPLAFFAGIGAASRQKILFKGGNAMELLAQVNTVVMDKTGTVTQGVFRLQSIHCAPGVDEQTLLSLAAGCEQHSTHPIARSILTAAQERGISPVALHQVNERSGKGIAADDLLCGSKALLEEAGVKVEDISEPMGTKVYLAQGGRYLGTLVISDEIKPGAAQAIERLHARGCTTALLTGDAAGSAEQVAKRVGIPTVQAGLMPQQKLEAIQALRLKGQRVLFVGDGINDAPVLAGADVGAAMGSGADAAIEAADVVYLTGDLGAIGESIRISATSVAVARQNVIFALGVKLAVILLGLLGRPNLWLAVFADSGVAMLCVCNSIRILFQGRRRTGAEKNT